MVGAKAVKEVVQEVLVGLGEGGGARRKYEYVRIPIAQLFPCQTPSGQPVGLDGLRSGQRTYCRIDDVWQAQTQAVALDGLDEYHHRTCRKAGHRFVGSFSVSRPPYLYFVGLVLRLCNDHPLDGMAPQGCRIVDRLGAREFAAQCSLDLVVPGLKQGLPIYRVDHQSEPAEMKEDHFEALPIDHPPGSR